MSLLKLPLRVGRWLVVSVGAVVAIGSSVAFQPAKLAQPQEISKSSAVQALQDDLELLEAQLKTRQAAAEAAEKRAKSEENLLKRMEQAATALEVAPVRAAADRARMEADLRVGELAELRVKVKIAKRKLDEAIANPPKAAVGPSATDEALGKLVQLMTERNKVEKEWMAAEAARLAKQERDAEARDKAAEVRAELAERRTQEAEKQLKDELRRRQEAEAERVRQDKIATLKRLPGEIADTEFRLRAVELKREQTKLELDGIAREAERLKAAKATLDELKATLDKELKAKNDR